MEELARLLQRIEGVRRDIAALRPADVQRVHLPSATDELDAIVVATEGATQTILDAAEKILATVPPSGELGSKVNEQIMRIFEACTFQDITGQRVTKVIRTMKEVEQVVSGLVRVIGSLNAQPAEDRAPVAAAKVDVTDERSLLNGPALPGAANSQADIDSLFAAAPTKKA